MIPILSLSLSLSLSLNLNLSDPADNITEQHALLRRFTDETLTH